MNLLEFLQDCDTDMKTNGILHKSVPFVMDELVESGYLPSVKAFQP